MAAEAAPAAPLKRLDKHHPIWRFALFREQQEQLRRLRRRRRTDFATTTTTMKIGFKSLNC